MLSTNTLLRETQRRLVEIEVLVENVAMLEQQASAHLNSMLSTNTLIRETQRRLINVEEATRKFSVLERQAISFFDAAPSTAVFMRETQRRIVDMEHAIEKFATLESQKLISLNIATLADVLEPETQHSLAEFKNNKKISVLVKAEKSESFNLNSLGHTYKSELQPHENERESTEKEIDFDYFTKTYAHVKKINIKINERLAQWETNLNIKQNPEKDNINFLERTENLVESYYSEGHLNRKCLLEMQEDLSSALSNFPNNKKLNAEAYGNVVDPINLAENRNTLSTIQASPISGKRINSGKSKKRNQRR